MLSSNLKEANLPLPPDGEHLLLPEVEQLSDARGFSHTCRIWSGQAGAPVLLHLHGIEGHSQWFSRTASVLNQLGVTVYALDRRGSGLNQGQRGHLPKHALFLADIEAILSVIASKHPNSALILMANCWAAKAAAILARQDYKPVDPNFQIKLSGVIFTCPAIYTKTDLSLKDKCKLLLSLLNRDNLSQKYWFLPLAPSMYTSEPQYLNYLEKDPLRLKEVTTSFLIETQFLSWRAQRSAKSMMLPFLLLQAGDDQIVDIERVDKWYRNVSSTDKAMHLFPTAFHSIDFDRSYFSEYTHLLSEWIFARKVASP